MLPRNYISLHVTPDVAGRTESRNSCFLMSKFRRYKDPIKSKL